MAAPGGTGPIGPFPARVGDADDSIHGSAAPVAYLLGFVWMNYLANQDDPGRIQW